jgi:multiple sugar transport system permease protein
LRLIALALKRKRWEPLAFASPSLGLIALVIAFPLAYSFWLSLQNFDLSVGSDYEFVGAKNYVEALFTDPRFLGSVWNTAVIIAPSLVMELVLGLALALLLSRVARGRPTGSGLRRSPS